MSVPVTVNAQINQAAFDTGVIQSVNNPAVRAALAPVAAPPPALTLAQVTAACTTAINAACAPGGVISNRIDQAIDQAIQTACAPGGRISQAITQQVQPLLQQQLQPLLVSSAAAVNIAAHLPTDVMRMHPSPAGAANARPSEITTLGQFNALSFNAVCYVCVCVCV